MTPEQLTQLRMIVSQYHELVAHVAQNAHDAEFLSNQFEKMLSSAVAAFAHDVNSLATEETVQVMRRITTSPDVIQELAQKGLTPYSGPLSVEDFLEVSPALIPLMLGRACVSSNFHRMHVKVSQVPSWQKFVRMYAHKLPSV